jgi:hypothetical protein
MRLTRIVTGRPFDFITLNNLAPIGGIGISTFSSYIPRRRKSAMSLNTSTFARPLHRNIPLGGGATRANRPPCFD